MQRPGDHKQIKEEQAVLEAKINIDGKKKKIYACFDGDKAVELYWDKFESEWLGTYDINEKICYYYISKFSSCRPDLKKYSITIPSMNLIINKIKGVRVKW